MICMTLKQREGGKHMIRPGKAVKHPKYDPQTVVIKPKNRKPVYRQEFPNMQEAELCVQMHERNGDRAFILERS